MSQSKDFKSASGRVLSVDEIEVLADEVATTDYDVAELAKRRRGRPSMGSGPAQVIPVRLDPEMRRAVEQRAGEDHTTTSDVIRQALRSYLHVS